MGRTVLITGAARGIGRATALAFAERGDRVAINHRGSPERAAELCDEMAGDGHMVVRGDVVDPEAVRNMVDEVAANFGRIDVLVNNAGVYAPHPIMGVTYAEWQARWRTTIETNLIGAANVIWCAVRHMGAGGRIVNVSSRGAYRGEPDHPAYGASKAGLNALAEGIRSDVLGTPITVSTILPGYIATDINVGRRGPFTVDLDTGVDALIAAIEREPVRAYVPGWPWRPVAGLLRVLPLPVVRRVT